MFLTRGRTGVYSLSAGWATVMFISLIRRPQWRKRINKTLSKPIVIVPFLLLFVVLLPKSLDVIDAAKGFIYKDIENITIAESFDNSRGFLITESVNNFIRNYWFGIGFGVSNSSRIPFAPVIEPVTGLPISAPTEKPNLPVALLEETGVIGTILFIPFMYLMMKSAISKDNILHPLVFFTAFFINFGEMMFFSAGGFGLFIWLLMAWAINAPVERVKSYHRSAEVWGHRMVSKRLAS
jgi:hypothetical protein